MDTRRDECYAANRSKGTFGSRDKFCELIFDGLLCWPATRAGQLAMQPCPSTDISHSITSSLQNASKLCELDGTWHSNPELNHTWSNYTLCNLTMYDPETAVMNMDISLDGKSLELYLTWFPIIKSISLTGYCVSILTLVCSVLVLSTIKKLHCTRNILHIHLFISFIMRALMFLLKELVLIEGIAFKSDVVMVNGKPEYITEHYNWLCKAVTSSWNYFIQANYMFILMEGIYLHNLMFLNLFSDKSSIRMYYLSGWGIPLIFISLWAVLRTKYDNKLCWTTWQNKHVSYLVQLPIEISVLINFVLFLSITRVLCMKINSMYLQQRRIKYRRLIRSTLTLVLIYGVPYAISTAVSHCNNRTVEIIWIFCDQTFTAFQGLLMASIYCIFNSEVRSEVRHKYNSMREKHKQNRRTRTISNTQQYTFPLQDEIDSAKVPWYKTTEHL